MKTERTAPIHRHISAKHNWSDLKLDEVWNYRDLILLFTRRSFAVKYRQTILGPLWLFISPLLTSFVHLIVFGSIAGLGTDGMPKILFYLFSTAVWSFFAECVTMNANTFTGNAALFGKVYFPRLTVPISYVLSGLLKFGVQMLLVLAFFLYFMVAGVIACPNPLCWLFVPLLLVWLGVLGMSIGAVISSLTTKYRDLTVLVGFGVTLWMYGTPIVYPVSQLGDAWYTKLILLNPVSAPVEALRYCLFGHGTVLPGSLVWSACVTAAAAVLGLILFNRVERTFLDTV